MVYFENAQPQKKTLVKITFLFSILIPIIERTQFTNQMIYIILYLMTTTKKL